MASQLISIQLSRVDSSTPWGFRLEGGVNLGRPLVIQRVTSGGLAERNGLRSGDKVIRINQSDTNWMRHDDAKMEIIRSSNDMDLVVQRGSGIIQPHSYGMEEAAVAAGGGGGGGGGYMSTTKGPITLIHVGSSRASPASPAPSQVNIWRPKVVSSVQLSPGEASPILTERTSLAANDYSPTHHLSRYNPESIGITHNASPMPFGAEPPAPGKSLVTHSFDGRLRQIGHSAYNSPMGLYTQRSVEETFRQTMSSAMTRPQGSAGNNSIGNRLSTQAPTLMRCESCGECIKGVFVKVQGRFPMHPSCLKCCKCGVGLRNVGYFYIQEKLFCETHAKMAAPPPEPGMKPVVVYK